MTQGIRQEPSDGIPLKAQAIAGKPRRAGLVSGMGSKGTMGGRMFGEGEQIENRRQAEMASYAILDTPAETEFDDIVKVASEVCGMPVSLISLLDGERQWFKAEIGFGQSETPLSQSICSYAVQQDDVFEIEDLTQDARTSNNALVTDGTPGPLLRRCTACRTPDGVALGALCVMDTKAEQTNAFAGVRPAHAGPAGRDHIGTAPLAPAAQGERPAQ